MIFINVRNLEAINTHIRLDMHAFFSLQTAIPVGGV
jgi:hypothetical protein